MQRFIKRFLIFIVLYHILVTVIQYGILGGAHPNAPAILRDAIRLVFIVVVIIYYAKNLKSYLKQRKWPRIRFIILIVFSVGISYFKGKSVSDILIGIKYGFIYIPIFLSATFIGHIWNNVEKLKDGLVLEGGKMERFRNFIKYFLVITLIVGFIRQILKFIRPDFFLHIGYGPFNDFVFGAKPPIYYLTGYQGTSRRQGLFSGPNNYGYFLISFLPLIITLCKDKIKNITNRAKDKIILRNIVVIILRIAAILLTLSRAARIGGIVALALINFTRIKKHGKIAGGIVALVIIGLAGLSILKRESTRIHLSKFFESINYIIQQPNGYGLGTSGPAIHHNGTILPENYFFQLILDVGTIGFIIWIISIRQIQKIAGRIKKYFAQIKNETAQQIYHLRLALTIGWIALLIMGFFLHVFEDSMVNYIFFILRGISTGYLYAQTRK